MAEKVSTEVCGESLLINTRLFVSSSLPSVYLQSHTTYCIVTSLLLLHSIIRIFFISKTKVGELLTSMSSNCRWKTRKWNSRHTCHTFTLLIPEYSKLKDLLRILTALLKAVST